MKKSTKFLLGFLALMAYAAAMWFCVQVAKNTGAQAEKAAAVEGRLESYKEAVNRGIAMRQALNALHERSVLFLWPINPADYVAKSSPFGERDPETVGGYGDDFHNGLDMFGVWHARIRACTDATVACVFPAPNGYYRGHTALGGLVILQAERQGDTFLFVHGHLSEVEVIEGATVAAGDLLGRQGNTGRSDGEHLHFGINQNGTLNTATGEITGGVWLNPLKYITEPGENNEKTR